MHSMACDQDGAEPWPSGPMKSERRSGERGAWGTADFGEKTSWDLEGVPHETGGDLSSFTLDLEHLELFSNCSKNASGSSTNMSSGTVPEERLLGSMAAMRMWASARDWGELQIPCQSSFSAQLWGRAWSLLMSLPGSLRTRQPTLHRHLLFALYLTALVDPGEGRGREGRNSTWWFFSLSQTFEPPYRDTLKFDLGTSRGQNCSSLNSTHLECLLLLLF